MTNNSTERTELRNTLLDNGYTPLPAGGKRVFIKGWTQAEIDKDWLLEYARKGNMANTGLRCDNLFAFDIDVLDEDLADELEAAIEDICGETDFCRVGKWPKRLLLYRMAEDYDMRSSRTGKYDGHQVELLTGRGRQFIAFGIHPDTDSPYKWEGHNPQIHAIDKVPMIGMDTATGALSRCEQILSDGRERQQAGGDYGNCGERLEDLTADFEVMASDGRVYQWKDFKDGIDPNGGEFVNIIRADGEFGDSGAVHAIISPGTGQPMLYDFTRDTIHVEPAKTQQLADALPEQQSNMFDGADLSELIDNYVLLKDKTVRDINRPAMVWNFDGFKLGNAHMTAPNPKAGTRGQPPIKPAVDVWKDDPRTMRADHAELRPDYPEDALITEGRTTVVNTYYPPDHTFGEVRGFVTEYGERDTFIEFVEHLIPNKAERDLFLAWLSAKIKNPGWRMHGLVMVTRAYGTGRGTMIQILQQLFGVEYVVEVPLKQLIGSSGQAEFNDFLADNLIVAVPEALEEREDQTKWQSRHLAYEQLKLVCDPISQRVHIRRKYGKNTVSSVYASLFISTNHVDALAIEPGDRRLMVLTNTETPLVDAPDDLNERIHQWKLDPNNIASLYWWLRKDHFIDYDPFGMPPLTTAKQAMITASQSDTDALFERFQQTAAGDLATFTQWRLFAYQQQLTGDFDLPHGDRFDLAIAAVWKKQARNVLALPRSGMKIDKAVARIYAIRNFEAWAGFDDREIIKNEVLKNGEIGGKVLPLTNS